MSAHSLIDNLSNVLMTHCQNKNKNSTQGFKHFAICKYFGTSRTNSKGYVIIIKHI